MIGEPYASCLIGHMFKESICHAKEKYECSILAANQGYVNEMYYLINKCLEGGELEQAEKWLIKAAEGNGIE